MGWRAVISYTLWMFGGFAGVHHLYLGDDQKCFLYAISMGGFGLGWFRDLFVLPSYYSPYAVQDIRRLQKSHRLPPISFVAIVASCIFSFWFGNLAFYCFPQDLVPASVLAASRLIGVATGSWLVFNSRRFQSVSFIGCLAGASLSIPLSALQYDTVFVAGVLATIGALFTRRWTSARDTGAIFRSDRSICARLGLLSAGYACFVMLLLCCIVMNAHVTTKDHQVVRLRTVIYRAVASGDVKEFGRFFFQASKRFVKKVSRLSGRKDHLAVLGLKETRKSPISDAQIKHAFRKLARKLHPDKPGGSAEEYQRIQDAYLSLLDK